jgi:hypothetical protein
MIIRSAPSRPMIIFKEDIEEYGWELAIVLANIPQCLKGDGSPMEEEDLYKRFPFFPKEKFNELKEKLIELGLAYREES